MQEGIVVTPVIGVNMYQVKYNVGFHLHRRPLYGRTKLMLPILWHVRSIAVALVVVAVRVMAREITVVVHGYRCCSWCIWGGAWARPVAGYLQLHAVGVALVKGPCQYKSVYGIGGTLYTDDPHQSCCRPRI